MLLRRVIRKYEGIARRGLPRVMTSAHREAFRNWESNFQEIALAALLPHATSEAQAESIKEFVETFSASNSGLLMKFCLYSQPVAALDHDVTAEDVERWVRAGAENNSENNAEGKVFDGRDGDVDEVVRKMQGILIYAKNATGSQRDAQEKYLPYIRAFISSRGVSPETIERWSQLVLNAWIRYVGATWPQIARRKLRELLRS